LRRKAYDNSFVEIEPTTCAKPQTGGRGGKGEKQLPGKLGQNCSVFPEEQMAGNDIIVKNPNIRVERPYSKGTRVPFQTLLDYPEGGDTLDQFLEDFPSISREAGDFLVRTGRFAGLKPAWMKILFDECRGS
jgi:uncharacterized protein (DUF433 family)